MILYPQRKKSRVILSLILMATVSGIALWISEGSKINLYQTVQSGSPSINIPSKIMAKKIPYLQAMKLRLGEKSTRPVITEIQSKLVDLHRNYQNKNYNLALQQAQALASQGNADAMNLLGMMYYFGDGVPQNFGTAFDWYEKAFIAGDEESPHHIGRFFFNGEGVEKDDREAFYWYQHAALRGNLAGMSWMGYFYKTGAGGVGEDRLLSVAWYTMIQEQDPKREWLELYHDMPTYSASEWPEVQAKVRELKHEMQSYRG
jgi:TPR repeat protein